MYTILFLYLSLYMTVVYSKHFYLYIHGEFSMHITDFVVITLTKLFVARVSFHCQYLHHKKIVIVYQVWCDICMSNSMHGCVVVYVLCLCHFGVCMHDGGAQGKDSFLSG